MNILNVNGFTILHKQLPTNILNIRAIVNTGSFNENSNEYGVAHFLEHMFFKGTLKRDYKEVNKITSELGDVNAYTTRDATVFYLSTLTSDFKKAADILLEMFFQPLFPIEEFEKEKTVILEEYQSGIDDPTHYFYGMLFESYLGTPRGHKIIGNRKSLIDMNLSDVISFRQRFYTIDNIAFSITGNVSEGDVISVFSDLLSDIPSQYYEKGQNSVSNSFELDYNDFLFNHKSQQAIIGVVNKAQNCTEVYDNNFVQEIFASGVGQGMHSLLFDRVREDLGLCYSIGMYSDSWYDNGALITICMLDEKNIELAKNEIFNIYNSVKDQGFSQELLDISKKSYLFDIARMSESSNGFSKMVMDDYFRNGRKLVDFDEIRSKVEKISNDDIVRYAKEYLQDTKFVQMTQG